MRIVLFAVTVVSDSE